MLVMPRVASYATGAEMCAAYRAARYGLRAAPPPPAPRAPSVVILWSPPTISDDQYAEMLSRWSPRPLTYEQIALLSRSTASNLPLTVRAVCAVVAHHFGVTLADVISASRLAKFMPARFAAMYVCRMIGHSFPRIGRRMGRRDHSTILNGCRRAVDRAQRDETYAAALKTLVQACGG